MGSWCPIPTLVTGKERGPSGSPPPSAHRLPRQDRRSTKPPQVARLACCAVGGRRSLDLRRGHNATWTNSSTREPMQRSFCPASPKSEKTRCLRATSGRGARPTSIARRQHTPSTKTLAPARRDLGVVATWYESNPPSLPSLRDPEHPFTAQRSTDIPDPHAHS